NQSRAPEGHHVGDSTFVPRWSAMSGRRRYDRFSMGQPWEGRLRVVRDVTVLDAADGQGVEFVSAVPGVPGEVMALELSGGRTVLTLVGCVTDSRPVVLEGTVQHAVRVLVVDETRHAEAGARHLAEPAPRAEVLEAADLVG